jgi:hypothetical protein
MASEICLENCTSHACRDAVAFSTGFGTKQDKLPDTFFPDTDKNGLKEDTMKADAIHVREGGVK